MSRLIDKIINFFKWPLAWYILLLTPAIIHSFHFFTIKNIKTFSLLGGVVFFIFSKIMMDPSVRTSMQIIAHELTHTFFALLTFHKVKHIRLNPDDTGGEMGFIGQGNWLIIVAPYFFPLFCFIYMCVMSFLPDRVIYHFILGYFLGYHIDTVASQIHPEQTDLKKAGYRFCFMFLPGINLLTIGFIFMYNTNQFEGVLNYFHLLNNLTFSYIDFIKNIFSSL